MKTKPIHVDYYLWLISQIDVQRDGTFNGLFERMHNMEFVWTVPNDDNRVQDGLDLRTEYLNLHGKRRNLLLEGVTVLEVLIALSRRAAFIASGLPEWWAWHLIENLQLHRYRDPMTLGNSIRIEEILHALIWRTYEPNGTGGFFPLTNPREDQTKREIWFQMNAYVNEIQAPE